MTGYEAVKLMLDGGGVVRCGNTLRLDARRRIVDKRGLEWSIHSVCSLNGWELVAEPLTDAQIIAKWRELANRRGCPQHEKIALEFCANALEQRKF